MVVHYAMMKEKYVQNVINNNFGNNNQINKVNVIVK
jgi:hypothetical protein